MYQAFSKKGTIFKGDIDQGGQYLRKYGMFTQYHNDLPIYAGKRGPKCVLR